MAKIPNLPNLDGLIGLAGREGVDVRPTLLRVLTDLYVQKTKHGREEELRYTELTLWLLTAADVPTRAAIARKLAVFPAAPLAIIRRLARDAFEVAEPILLHAAGLADEELRAIADQFQGRHAQAVTARHTPGVVAPAAEIPSNENAPLPSGGRIRVEFDKRFASIWRGEASVGARSFSGPSEVEAALGDRFLAANRDERRTMLTALEEEAAKIPAADVSADASQTVTRLEAAALECRSEDFAQDLMSALGLTRAQARRVIADEWGEPLLVAMKALAMPSDVFLRVLLFLNPAIGQSVERVFGLVDLYYTLSTVTAARLAASWAGVAGVAKRGRHQALLFNDENQGARRSTFGQGRAPPQPAEHQQPTRADDRLRGQGTT